MGRRGLLGFALEEFLAAGGREELLPVGGDAVLGDGDGDGSGADLLVEPVFDLVLLEGVEVAEVGFGPEVSGVEAVAAEFKRNEVVFLVVGEAGTV